MSVLCNSNLLDIVKWHFHPKSRYTSLAVLFLARLFSFNMCLPNPHPSLILLSCSDLHKLTRDWNNSSLFSWFNEYLPTQNSIPIGSSRKMTNTPQHESTNYVNSRLELSEWYWFSEQNVSVFTDEWEENFTIFFNFFKIPFKHRPSATPTQITRITDIKCMYIGVTHFRK